MGLLIPGHFHFFSIDYISSLEHSGHSTAVDFMNEGKTEKGKREGGRKVKRRGQEAGGSCVSSTTLPWVAGVPQHHTRSLIFSVLFGSLFSLFYFSQ